jgi:hypothetical protein
VSQNYLAYFKIIVKIGPLLFGDSQNNTYLCTPQKIAFSFNITVVMTLIRLCLILSKLLVIDKGKGIRSDAHSPFLFSQDSLLLFPFLPNISNIIAYN